MFQYPFSFEGRIRRTEYGISLIIYWIILIIVGAAVESGGTMVFLAFIYLPLVWFFAAQGAKRCHDRGNTGWFQIIPFYSFWMVFADSDRGINGYGPNPKGIDNE